MKRFLSDKSGVAATEFALMAPPLLLLVIGMFDFGTYLNVTMKLENTARAAVEYVFQGGDPDNIQEEVFDNSSLGAEFATVEVTKADYVCACEDGAAVDCDTGTCDADGDYKRRYFEVTLDMEYDPLMSYPGLGDTMSLRGHTILRMN